MRDTDTSCIQTMLAHGIVLATAVYPSLRREPQGSAVASPRHRNGRECLVASGVPGGLRSGSAILPSAVIPLPVGRHGVRR